MKRIVSLTLAATTLAGPRSWAQHPSGDTPIRVVLPRGVETATCHLQYYLIGSFGGYGEFARPKLDASWFEIETVREGHAVERLQVALSCPGYQIETMAFDSLPDVDARTVQVHLKPLGTLRFRGLVRGLTLQQVQVLYVDVDYTPWWICEFFRLSDCGLGPWRVASVRLDTDGRFVATLPDFSRDAVISSFNHHGEFAFRIRDQETGNRLFELKAAGSNSLFRGRVAVADSYPGEQLFDAEVAR